MQNRFFRSISLALLLFVSPFILSAAAWPSPDLAGVSVASELYLEDPDFEPSGAIWHSRLEQYLTISDEGQVAFLSETGEFIKEHSLGAMYDLEDIAVTDELSDLVYLLDENTSEAREFNIVSGAFTGKKFSFAGQIVETDNLGAEGLAWVPDGYHPFAPTPSGGLFYVGNQIDGDIYVFEPDLATGATTFLEELSLTPGYTDLASLAFSKETGLVYALYDGLNLLEERTTSGDLIVSYEVPANNQEGIAVRPDCATGTANLLIADDPIDLRVYSDYPILCALAPSLGYEIADGADNDSDFLIDELNTIAENSSHPSYLDLDPFLSIGDHGVISGVAGTAFGHLTLSFADSSAWDYLGPETSSIKNSKVKVVTGSSFLLVVSAGEGAIVNPYNGETVATTVFSLYGPSPMTWARSTLGI